jgi:hypothetical protein
MQVGYSSAGGPRYLCGRGQQLYGTGRCQSIGGRRLESVVLDEVFRVLEPAALAATAQALAEAEAHHAQRLRVFELAVERARYEAERARRQFDAVEPENRLVARTLERTWEERLAAVRQAEADLATQQARRPVTLSPDEAAWLNRAGADLRTVFDAPTTTARDRKQLLRALIGEVVVTVDAEEHRATGRIVWQGGATSDIAMVLPRRGVDSARRTEADTIELVRRLAVHYDDTTIARLLARQGGTTATGLPFTTQRVASLRRLKGIPGHQTLQRHSPSVTPRGDDVAVVSVTEAERLLGTSRATPYRWVAEGFIAGEQDTPGGPWRIRIDAALRAKIVPDIPDGWVGLADAAKTLGVARQTVLGRVRRGELDAVHVNRGRRKGLAIHVPARHGLFDDHATPPRDRQTRRIRSSRPPQPQPST